MILKEAAELLKTVEEGLHRSSAYSKFSRLNQILFIPLQNNKNMQEKKYALIVVDMTNDFLYREYNKSLALERAKAIIPRIRKLQDFFIENGMPVIYASDRHLPNDFELKKWPPHSMKGTKGSEIVDGLLKENILVLERDWKEDDLKAVEKTDRLLYEVEKGSYSGFTDNGGKLTAMDALLKKLGFEPGDVLYITGLHANCCDKHTAADAWFRGYEPSMVKDCVDSFDDPDGTLGMNNEQALRYEKYWYNAEITDSEEIINRMKGTA